MTRGRAEALPTETPRSRPPAAADTMRGPRLGLGGAFAHMGGGGLRTLAGRAVLAMLLLATLLRGALLLRGWPSLDSDEAVVGLMARHVLHNGELPDFFWGQFYLGPLQAYLAAPIFAVFGSSLLALRLPVLLLTLGLLAAVYALGRAAYGRAVGLLALAWLALGPPFALIRTLVADGGHQEMLLLAALVLLGVWDRLRRPAVSTALPAERHARLRLLGFYLLLGAAMGLGFWSDPLMLPVLLVALVVLAAGRPRELFSPAGLALVLGACLGAFPFLLFNVTTGGASFVQIAHQRQLPGGSGGFVLGDYLNQLGETLAVALPTIFGSPHVCVTEGNIWSWYPPALGETTRAVGLCQSANMLFSLGILALYTVAAVPILRALWLWLRSITARRSTQSSGTPGGRASPPSPPRAQGRGSPTGGRGGPRYYTQRAERGSNERIAALWLRGMLLDIALLTLAAYTTGPDAQRNQFTAARYLILLYLTAPLLFGTLWQWSAPVYRALGARLGPRLRTVIEAAKGRRPQDAPMDRREQARGRPQDAPTNPRAFAVASPAPQSHSDSSSPSVSSASSLFNLSLPSAVSALLLALVFALAVVEAGMTLAYSGDSTRFGLPATRSDQRLI
ncbi:MAG TPA: hypothetical protein VFU88_21485, partial [Ktedonobacterales bacterium]|nr:hypothetical protein [Ktedonobacterales bacterium]